MTEQDAIERVAGVLDDALGDLYVDGDVLDMNDIYNITAAAIAAYNAYLRERATDNDVVEAMYAITAGFVDAAVRRDAKYALTAVLDAMLGKETDDDR